MVKKAKNTSNKLQKRDVLINRTAKISLFLFLSLLFIYILLNSMVDGGRFFIYVDPNFSLESGIFMYDNIDEKNTKPLLTMDEIDFMDNISIDWIPKDIGNHNGGSNNGENYIAYTFYLENFGKKTVNYWYEVNIDNVIKNVDEAIRFVIILNDERTVYAKLNKVTGLPEKDTEEFFDKNKAVLEKRESMEPGSVDKLTIVIFLEGDDPECTDELIGGEIKANMRIIESHIEPGASDE